MSKLSELKTIMEKATKAESQNTKQIVQQTMNELSNSLQLECQNVSNNFSKNMAIEQQKLALLTKTMFNVTKFVILIGIAIPLIAWGVISYLAIEQYQEMTQWKQSAEIYKAESKGMMFKQCRKDQVVMPCIEIDPNFQKAAWDNGTLKAVKVYPTKTTTKKGE